MDKIAVLKRPTIARNLKTLYPVVCVEIIVQIEVIFVN